jgi:hypothetical protein
LFNEQMAGQSINFIRTLDTNVLLVAQSDILEDRQ